MRRTTIAIISDIHGNPFAFEAVEADIASLGVDQVIVAGDLVGRGPFGGAIVDRVEALGWPTIRGNHEDYLLAFRRRDVPDAWLETDEWAASRWMAAALTERHEAFIDALPFSHGLPLGPGVRVVHGSPRSHSEGLGPWMADDDLANHLATVDESVLVCAHTHRPMIRHVEGGTVINVGSVGLPFNGDWRAQYALLTASDDGLEFTLRQVAYDRDAFLHAYQTSGFLAEGGITSALLYREVELARPMLVPFLTWARACGYEPSPALLSEFDGVYDPTRPIAEFLAALEAMGGSERQG